jgi:hypothetical protein
MVTLPRGNVAAPRRSPETYEVDGDSTALRQSALVGAHGFELPVGELRLVLEVRQRKAQCRRGAR